MQLLVELFDSEGHILASYPLSLSAGEYHQERRPFLVRAGRSDLESAWAAVTVLSGRDLLAFSSVLDARSNDPGVRSGAPEE